MLGGVTYPFAIGNAILCTELFLLFKSAWVVPIALIIHAAGWVACLRDPHFFDLWLIRIQRSPRVRNHRIWHCNSYQA